MPLYTCQQCNFNSKFKGDYNRHLKTKKHQANINGGIEKYDFLGEKSQKEPVKSQKEPEKSQKEPVKSQKYSCDYCDEQFKTYANMRRHEIHRCKENPDVIDRIIEAKNRRIKKLEKEKEELYGKIDELISKVGDTNIQNNIIINNYGDEDLSYITDKIKSELVKIPYGAIPKLIESVHFNDKKPENKNIVMPNKKENVLKVYHGDKWVYRNKNETIRDLIDSKYLMIDNHFEETKENVSGIVKRSYSKFRKYYDDGDEELVKDLKRECELVLLNNRDCKKVTTKRC